MGVKSMSRGSAADAESYRPELLADEEPRYLRRQKPVEIRRRKFGGRSWPFYRRVLFCGVVGIAGISAAWTAGHFLLYGRPMLLVKPEQIEVNGNHIVSREAVLQQFVRDRGRSVLRIHWIRGAARLKKSHGSSPRWCSAFFRIASGLT